MAMTMNCDLGGKTIIVTGASSGLGAHFATVLSAAGARVARRRDRLENLAREIVGRGAPTPVIAEADVTSVASINNAVKSIVTDAGVVSGLVNNAGTVGQANALDIDEDGWDHVVDTNLTRVRQPLHAP